MNKNKSWIILGCILCSFALLLIHAFCSYLGELGDEEVYKYVAKLMLEGKIPYRDVFDHKGPIVYFLYALGRFLHPIYGTYVIELLFIIGIFFSALRMIARFISPPPIHTPYISAAMITVSFIFLQVGPEIVGNTELYSIFFIILCCNVFCAYIMDGNLNRTDAILLGISFAVLLLIKPIHIICPLVLGIYALIIGWKRKDIAIFNRLFIPSLLSFLTIFFTILFYFYYHGAVIDFYNAYIVFNIFYTMERMNIADALKCINNYLHCPIIFLPIGIFPFLLKSNFPLKKIVFPFFLAYAFTFLIMFLPGRNYNHYVGIIAPIALILLAIEIAQLNTRGQKMVLFLMSCFIFLYIFSFCLKKINSSSKEFDESFISALQEEIPPNETFLNLAQPHPSLHLLSDRNSYSKYPFTWGSYEIRKLIKVELKEKGLPLFVVVRTIDLETKKKKLKIKFADYHIVYKNDKYALLKKNDCKNMDKKHCKERKKRKKEK